MSGVLKFPSINVWVSMYDLSFSNISFTNVDNLIWGHRCSELTYHFDPFFFFDEYEVSFPVSFAFPCAFWFIFVDSLFN